LPEITSLQLDLDNASERKRISQEAAITVQPPAFCKYHLQTKTSNIMSLIRRSDWPTLGGSLLSDFFDDERFFGSPWLTGRSLPAVNIKENDKSYEIEVAAPGYDKKDFNISIDNGLLTVSAEKREEKEKKEDNYTRREFGFSSFSRSFNLPTNINDEHVDAKYTDGVLKLTIEKKQESNGKARKAISVS
jgi:HSP20 family protein